MKYIFYCGFLLGLLSPVISRSQETIAEANALLDAAQLKFTAFTASYKADQGIKELMLEYGTVKTDSLQQAFNGRSSAPEAEKINSINCLKFFLQSLRVSLEQQKFEIYDLPDALQKFPLIANAIVNNKPYREYTLGFGGRRTQLMADAFRQYPEGKRLQYAADARRLAVNTDNIIPLLERQPDFPFVDTALIYLANRSPITIVEYLSSKNNRVTDSINASTRPVIQELVRLKGNRNASELAHFAEEIASGRHTAEEIQLLRSNNVKGYYQLLVNTIQSNRAVRLATGGPVGMQPALRSALHEKAVAFYINQINGLHESKEQVRFQSIQTLRTVDLYYLIISGEEELYTSSFLGIYKRIMSQLPKGQSDSLLYNVQFDQFRKFVRVCSHYNVLTDYLNNMPEQSRQALLHRFITGIEVDTDTGLEEAMDVADAFAGLSVDPLYSTIVAQLLNDNLNRCNEKKLYYGSRLYSILIDVFKMSNSAEEQKNIFAKLGNYETLPIKSVQDKDGIIQELVIFYGDEDGKTSYQNFMALFRDAKTWSVEKSAQWVVIKSQGDQQSVRLYANLPLDHETNLDAQAQLALISYLKTQAIEPGVIIHRGHSYHLPGTLNYLQPNMKLAILGSCGGYRNILTVADKSPSAQIVATKQVGSKLINDPMIQLVNTHFLQSKDISWPEVWATMGETFNKSPFTRDLFAEYVPPYRNLSLFVIRLFNYDEDTF
jgi:hypothetical protein